MGEKTKISWCDATFNPWIGCTKVAPGCTNCYAEADMDTRRGRVEWGPNGTRSKTSDDYWKKPYRWDEMAKNGVCFACHGRGHIKLNKSDTEECESCNTTGIVEPYRLRVFCASLADVFEDWQGPILYGVKEPIYLSKDNRASNGSNRMTMNDVRGMLFELIDATPNLDWLLVTKRPENIRRMWVNRAGESAEKTSVWSFRHNCWLLCSVSDQPTADSMIPELLKARDLVPVLGVSAEPLLGPVDFKFTAGPRGGNSTLLGECGYYCDERVGHVDHVAIDLIITGGESGPRARPHNIRWSREIGQQCQAAGVAWFHKQHGSRPIAGGDFNAKTGPMEAVTLKDRAGSDPAEWGEGWLQQMPEVPHA